MTIREILKKYPGPETELFLGLLLARSREFILASPGFKLPSSVLDSMASLVSQRQKGLPAAYLLGYKDFYGLRFKVNRHVLVPRPETEWLVERALWWSSESWKDNKILRILDMGTGSGCIAISVCRTVKKRAEMTAVDVSAKALSVARTNACVLLPSSLLGRVKFIRSDLFKNIKGSYELILANLPYIPVKTFRRYVLGGKKTVLHDPFSGLKYEPSFALSDGSNSWRIYGRFFRQAGAHIASGGVILLEIDPGQKKLLPALVKKYMPFSKLSVYRDFRGLWRYAEISNFTNSAIKKAALL